MAKHESTRREFMRNAAALGAAGWAAGAIADTGDPADKSPARNFTHHAKKPKEAPQKSVAAPAPETPATPVSPAPTPAPAPAVPVAEPAVAPTPATPAVAMGASRIRCGFIGVGNRGSSILQSTLKLDGVDVVAIADTYDVWRDRAVGWCKAKRTEVGSYIHFEDMFDQEKLDAVVIATPDHIHAAAIICALDHQCAVYTEKPMTLTVDDAKRIRARVKETGCVLQVGTQLRSLPMYQKAREVIQSGKLGPLVLVQVNRHSSDNRLDLARVPGEATEKNVHWKPFLRTTKSYPYDPIRYFNWRQFLEYSNGYFGDLMLHHLDMCHFLTGCAMPFHVKGAGGIYFFDDGRTCPDTVSALLEYQEKFHFNFTSTAVNGHYGLVERYMCAEGTLEIRGMSEMSIFRKEVEEKVVSEGLFNEPHLKNFFECIQTRAKPIAPVEAGMMGAACARMALESMQKGTAAVWDRKTESALV